MKRYQSSLGIQAHINEHGLLQCHTLQIVGVTQILYFVHTVMAVSIPLWVPFMHPVYDFSQKSGFSSCHDSGPSRLNNRLNNDNGIMKIINRES